MEEVRLRHVALWIELSGRRDASVAHQKSIFAQREHLAPALRIFREGDGLRIVAGKHSVRRGSSYVAMDLVLIGESGLETPPNFS